MMTIKILEVGAVKIGLTGTMLHRAKRIETAYHAGTSHPMSGKSTVKVVVMCKCGCKGSKNASRIQFFPDLSSNCGAA